MPECNKAKNMNHCTCTYDPCSHKGVCCECLQFHWKNKELPGCLFPEDSERSYDRSLRNFIEVWQKRL